MTLIHHQFCPDLAIINHTPNEGLEDFAAFENPYEWFADIFKTEGVAE